MLDTVRIVLDLDKRGVGFRSLTESFDTKTPLGRGVLALLAAVADDERERLRERTAKARFRDFDRNRRMITNIAGLPISETKAGVSGLRQAIAEALYPTSANLLADVCEGFGLAPGTRDEAFSSKRQYVMKRVLPLSAVKVLDLARHILTEYPNEDLERAIQRANLSHPADSTISNALASFDTHGVHAIWIRALERRERDPEGAITLGRTLLEQVSKHIIEEAGESYGEKDDLPKLYRAASVILKLAPDQHTEDTFKRILGSCQSVVEGLGTMRNKLSDAHGRGKRPAKPQARHAALAVNLAGAMATFLIETWNERQRGGT